MLIKSTVTENKKFIKLVSVLALPILLQDLVNTLVNLLDSFMIGSLGLNAINAVGFANQLFFLYSLLMFGICSGSSIMMGQYFGKKDFPSIHKVMGLSFIIGLTAAVGFALIAVIFPQWFIRLYSDNPEVIELGTSYFRVIAVSYLITPITMTVNFALRSMRKTNIPMITIIIALVTNAVLNYVFIFIVKWGVSGAALATVIARVMEFVGQQIICRKLKLPVFAPLKEYFSFSLKFVKECFSVTFPVILNEFTWALGMMMYQIAYKKTGNESQGAYQIASAIQQMFFIVGMALGASTGILIANALGAGEREKAISYSRKALVFNMIIGFAAGVLLIAAAPLATSFYNVSSEVKDIAIKILMVTGIAMTIRLFNYTTIVGILRNGGDTKFCLLIDCGGVWLVGVPIAFIGAYFLHLPIYWIVAGTLLEEVFKGIFSGIRVLRNKWANTLV